MACIKDQLKGLTRAKAQKLVDEGRAEAKALGTQFRWMWVRSNKRTIMAAYALLYPKRVPKEIAALVAHIK